MSKWVSLGLGIVGGVVGAIYGGPAGAFVGFSIGYGLGTIIDPMVPDIPSPGEPMTDLEMMTNTEGLPLPDILGTTKTSGNLLWYGANRRTKIKERVDDGGSIFGSSTKKVVTGYRYFLNWALCFCLGPVDTLYTVYADDDVVWSGELHLADATNGELTIILMAGDRDKISGYEDESGRANPWQEMFDGMNSASDKGVMGMMTFYFGTDTQEPNIFMGQAMEADSAFAPADGFIWTAYHLPYRRQCYAYLHNNYIGSYNRCPTIKVVIRKAPYCSFDPE